MATLPFPPHVVALLRESIRRVVRESDVEDVLHEVFLAVLSGTVRLDGAQRPVSYLTGVALNLARIEVRRQLRRRRLNQNLPNNPAQESGFGRVEARQLLERVDLLPRRKREIVRLRHLEQRPLAEVGALTGLSLATVKRELSGSAAWLRSEHVSDSLRAAPRKPS